MFPIKEQDLINLIPQKPPFVLVSELLEVTENTCKTIFSFTDNHILSSNGKLSVAGILEHMAQSSGCKLGYEDFMAGKSPRRGFIGEIKDVVISRLPNSGEQLTTEILVESKVFGAVTIVAAKTQSKNEVLATCRMKIFFEPDR